MAKKDSGAFRHDRKKAIRWVVAIFAVTIVISGFFSLLSETVLANSGLAAAFFILLVIVAVGIFFDILGVAVTSANEKPFHSMAARKVRGAPEAIRLLRNAERVSSICNDVVGDICGVVSGAASAVIALRLIEKFDFTWPKIISLAMSAFIAGLTVGGKAIGKTFAINSCTSIVYMAGKAIDSMNRFCLFFKKKM